MKKIVQYSVITALLIGAAALPNLIDRFDNAQAADPHAGHDHAAEAADPHAGHDHAAEAVDPHAGHDHAAEAVDPHAGHDHAAEAVDPHAGHDHELESLFDLESDDDGHDHDAQETGHNAHGSGEIDDHAGHDHAAVAPDAYCSAHNVLERQDALCQPGGVAELEPGRGMLVRLHDKEVAAKTGIETTKPVPVPLGSDSIYPGQVVFNRNRLAQITALSNGIVTKVVVRPGSRVIQGQLLAQVDMPEVAALKAELLSASAQVVQEQARLEREQALYEKGVTSLESLQLSQSDYASVRSTVDKYRQQLSNFGLSMREIDAVLTRRSTEAQIQVCAPFDGTVIELNTAQGEQVGSETPLLTLADLTTLWIELAVPESHIARLQPGGAISVQFQALPGQAFDGKLFYVGAVVDERTRTLTAMAEIQDPNQQLRAGMYGDVELVVEPSDKEMAIDADAIQMIDNQPFVFIEQLDDLFEVRRVETGIRKEQLVAVAGLTSNDDVVIARGFALKSELLKARLGAS